MLENDAIREALLFILVYLLILYFRDGFPPHDCIAGQYLLRTDWRRILLRPADEGLGFIISSENFLITTVTAC